MELFEHQKKALSETEQFNKVGYFLDMGLGKTFVGSEKAIKGFKQNVVLVVCQHSKIDDWVSHFKTNYATHDHDYFPQLLEAFDVQMVLNDGTLVAKLTPKIDRELGMILQRKKRGMD